MIQFLCLERKWYWMFVLMLARIGCITWHVVSSSNLQHSHYTWHKELISEQVNTDWAGHHLRGEGGDPRVLMTAEQLMMRAAPDWQLSEYGVAALRAHSSEQIVFCILGSCCSFHKRFGWQLSVNEALPRTQLRKVSRKSDQLSSDLNSIVLNHNLLENRQYFSPSCSQYIPWPPHLDIVPSGPYYILLLHPRHQQQQTQRIRLTKPLSKWGDDGDNFQSIFLMGWKYGKIAWQWRLYNVEDVTRVTTGNFFQINNCCWCRGRWGTGGWV